MRPDRCSDSAGRGCRGPTSASPRPAARTSPPYDPAGVAPALLDEVREGRRCRSRTAASPPRTPASRRRVAVVLARVHPHGQAEVGPAEQPGRSWRATLSVRPTAPPIGARITCANGAGMSAPRARRACRSPRLAGPQRVDLQVLADAERVAGLHHLLHRGVRHRLHHVEQRGEGLAQRPQRLLALVGRADVA